MKPIIQKSLLILFGLALTQQVFSQAPNISYTSSTSLTSGTLFSISPTNTGGAVPATVYGQVTTVAGSIWGTGGYVNATGTAARFNRPVAIVVVSGNLYVADDANNAVRMITPAGVVSTFAGSATGASGFTDATGTAALFNAPDGLAFDASGNLFVADKGNNAIRKVTPGGIVTTFYHGTGSFGPAGLCFDSSGNLIVAAQSASQVWKITPTGVATTIAGNWAAYANGTGTSALFQILSDVEIDGSGNIIVADYLNNAIRKITPAGVVTTLAGSAVSGNTGGFANGVGTAARFNNPNGVAIAGGGIIYVTDFENNDIRRIMPDGTVTLVAGSPTQASGTVDGTGTAAQFSGPDNLYVDGTGTGYVSEYGNRVKKIVLTGYTISGTLPAGLSFDATTGIISGTPTGTITTQTDTITAYNASGYVSATITFSPAVIIPAPNIKYAASANNLTAGTPFSISPTNTGGTVPATVYGQVTTIAGSLFGSSGYVNATGTAARFNTPKRLVKDASGNLYVGDAGNNAIRKITPAGVVTTFAGSPTGASGFTNGTGTAALFNAPGGMAIDASGNFYVSDNNNNVIRKITPAGVVTTFYSGTSTFGPAGLCFDSSGNLVVVAQTMRQILKISPSGVATSIAGSNYGYANGTGAAALFENPTDVKIDASGNMFIADYLNNAIRKITPAGVVTTYAGSDVSGNTGGFLDGTGTAAKFNNPTGLAMTPGGVIYVAELANQDIRRIMPDGTVKLIAGSLTQASGNTDATGTAATFNNPLSIYIDNTGTGYVVDMFANVRKIVLTGYSISGTLPAGLTFDPTTGIISGTPTGSVAPQTYTITAYNASGHSSTTITLGSPPTISYSGSQSYTYNVGTPISSLNPTVTNNPVPYTGYTTTFAGSGALSSIDGIGTAASFSEPAGATVDSKGNIYTGDAYNTNLIRKISPSAVVTTLAGSGSAGFINGTGSGASFNHPAGLATDTSGNVYVADEFNNAIRKVTPSGVVTTLAGGTQGSADGTGTSAQFYHPTGLVVDASGNVYVADYYNNVIRKITPAGVVTTFAGGTLGSADGTGTTAQFYACAAITMDASGNFFVIDRYNQKIRKITPAGVVTTIAGNGTAGFADGPAASAMFNYPTEITVDGIGNLYVADYNNHRVRQITPAGMVTTLAGSSTYGTANGVGSSATFGGSYGGPAGLSVDASGSLYAAEYQTNLIRKVVTTAYTISPTLPAGLTFDPATGIISGIPTTALAATTYTITAYNMIGIGSTTLRLAVAMPVPLAPSSNQNYIIACTPRVSGMATASAVVSASGDQTKIQTSIQYFDGLGRPSQTVQVKGSPSGKDVVHPTAYDQFGREATKYLPYAASTNDGSYKTTAFVDQGAYYTTPPTGVSAIPYPSAQTGFEPSPLNRVVEQGATGAAWQLSTSGVSGSGHTVKMVYTTNNTTGLTDTANTYFVALYSISAINSTDQSRTLVRGSGNLTDYTAGQLYLNVTRNENWVSGKGGTTEEYKDKESHIILKRTFNYVPGATPTLQILSTYYVYDDLGNLAYVLPPLSNADNILPTQTTLDNLCYQYRYDERNRLTQKRIPGKGWEYIVYNQLDQPVLAQDAVQRATNQWTVTKYDGQGRVIMTGLWNAGSFIPLATLQASIYATVQWDNRDYTNNTTGYNTGSYPAITTTLITNYYDDYNNIPSEPSVYATAPTGGSTMIKGLLTATKTAVLNTPADMLWTVHYYDGFGRSIQSYKQHYLSGPVSPYNYDAITTTYDFTNAVTTTTRQHYTKNTANTAAVLGVTVSNRYIYDHIGRKLKTWQQLQNGTQTADTRTLISKIDYNETGQVLTKHLHSTDSTNFLQNVAYTYNERGWLLTSSAQLFAMQLQYNTGSNKAYNGNIMYQLWGTPSNLNHSYTYTYDMLNRIAGGTSDGNNNEKNISYDLMGNLTALNRYQANTIVDQLTYTYTGNQLTSITDATTNDTGLKHGAWTYTYDGNGNLITDPSKGASGISIAYNLLNLPQNIAGSKTITYTYDAAGNKLRRVSPNTGNSDYISGIQYDGTTTPVLNFIQTEEGRVLVSGTSYNYEYSLGDNLGNSRITFDSATGIARQVQQDDYYPFGMEINSSFTSPKNEYLYNKKELQEEFSQYDYGARFYDPVIARWNTIDPLTEISRRWSPYNYVEDNPIRMTDPDGMDPHDTNIDRRQMEEGGEATSASAAAAGGAIAAGSGGPSHRHKLPKSVTNWQILKNFLFGDPVPGVPETNVMGGGLDDNPISLLIEGPLGLLGEAGESSIWGLGASERGFAAERLLGGNLPYGFPVIDKFVDGVATSVKSIDVTSKSFTEGNALFNTLTGYIRKLTAFQGGARGGIVIENGDITGKVLEVALQKGKPSSKQLEQIGNALKYAKSHGVQMIIKYIK